VFENRVLRDEVRGDWRKLHNELRDLYCLPGTIGVIEWRMKSGACSAYGWRRATQRGFRRGNLPERDNFEDLGAEERLKLKWILKKQDGTEWSGLNWHRIWPIRRNLVKMVMNLRDSENAKNLTSAALLAS
jgi:hypothetical protein